MRSILLRRAAAYVLDIIILFAVLAPLGYAVQRALGVVPDTARGIYGALVVNFSIPAWAYFALSDHSAGGATLGKRWLSLRTGTEAGGRVGAARAFGRTAVKMVPWEMTHASSFLFVPALGEFGIGNWLGIGCAYVLIFLYLIVAWRTRGRRSVHDMVASTRVGRATSPVEVGADAQATS